MTNSTVEVVKKCCCGQFKELSLKAVEDIKNRAGRDGMFLNWIEKLILACNFLCILIIFLFMRMK